MSPASQNNAPGEILIPRYEITDCCYDRSRKTCAIFFRMITKTSRKLVCFLIVCAIIIKLFLLTDGERQSEDIVAAANGRKNLISPARKLEKWQNCHEI